ncbi:2-amino-4-hydroxy-6-hydroxymethyldihydropteridine diphosphokinase [Blattabacterium cuenoti]|uniref:2-amino-4-hydroxy-6- hydroxymethyldihydropteridine diphosphokinase n=1 Tax=Blattabacterium cuenoti TaxID=1653831 RepID=UPI00163B9014|nr:2-amino-4-hydroxy-6-hydroxymethyldihydropteridine diphosphokinase [Blattabacterium cuenoti]
MLKEHDIFLLIGGNQGNRKKYLDESSILIDKKIGKIIKKSSFFKSEGWKMKKNTPYFLNQIINIKTFCSPISLMDKIKKIENSIEKKSEIITYKNKRIYKNRKIDIDILFYDQLIIYTSNLNLIIPHYLFHLRKFILIPMCEINPNKLHPVFKMTILEILGSCSDNSIVKKFL